MFSRVCQSLTWSSLYYKSDLCNSLFMISIRKNNTITSKHFISGTKYYIYLACAN